MSGSVSDNSWTTGYRWRMTSQIRIGPREFQFPIPKSIPNLVPPMTTRWRGGAAHSVQGQPAAVHQGVRAHHRPRHRRDHPREALQQYTS